MRCDGFLKRFDGLGDSRGMSRAMLVHLGRCASCREAVARVDAAIVAYRAEGSGAERAEGFLEDRVMAIIRLAPPPRPDILIRDWLMVGAIIALSMALIPLGEEFDRLKAFFGTSYSLPLSLVLGSVLTIYGAFFIGTHMEEADRFVRRFARPR
jgi:hypothetical protein